jgi:PAS domain S-box-containing protein
MEPAPKDLTEALREAALAVSTAEGEHVFEQLVSALARILGVEFALISVYVEPQRTLLRTLATYFDGKVSKNVEYPVAGTPCESAIGRTFAFFPEGIAQKYPHDGVLAEHRIEGYAATTLHGVQGAPIGALTVMSRRRIENAALTEAMLKIFAARVAAEIERRRSAASYRTIFESAESCIFLHDYDSGEIVDVNPKACAVYGYTPEEMRRLTVDEISSGVPPYTGAEALRLIERARAGEVVRAEWHRRNKDGSLHWDEITLKKVEIAGRPHILAVTREITGRKAAEERLRASEEQYRAIFNASADALVLRGADYRIVDVNPAYVAMSGIKRESVIGDRRVTMRFLGSDEELHALHQRVLAGAHERIEASAPRRDGSRVYVEVLAVPMQYRGAPHVLYIGRNITERKRAEEALRASEEQYRAIFDATADALLLRDADFRVVDANPAYEQLSGRRREEVLGSDSLTMQVPEGNDQRRELHRKALAGEIVHMETAARRKDGTPFRMEVVGVPMSYRGKPHVLYIGRDITERKQAEEALRASEEQYRAIFNASTDALLLRDAEFRVVDVNAAYERISGYTRAEVVGKVGLTFSAPENEAWRRAMHARALAGEPVQFEVEGVSKDGRHFTVDVRAVPISYGGRPHVLQMSQDITERKRAEAERQALETQLRQAQKMEVIGQLTGGIAHDFNNILQGILGNLVLAEERQAELGDARLGRYLKRAGQSAHRARDLIRQMLTFSRGQQGERRAVAPADLARDAMALLRPTLPATISLESELDTGLPATLLDPVQIEQVLLNLCINARDAMGGSGRIRVRVRAVEHRGAVCASCRQRMTGRFIEFVVRDSGPGIPPAVLDRIFDPFFSTKEAGKGSGMGLAMVHGIVHQHGGHILVESEPGDGAKFRVLFDWPANAAGPAPARGGEPGANAARPRFKGRVLVADDEEMIRDFLADLLGGWGLEVVAQADGAAARDAFAEDPQSFDAVITDQTMPQLTGMQLAKLVTRMRPGIPVILCSGYGDDLKPRELEAAGVRALARKPVEPQRLRELLSAALPSGNKTPT